MAPKHIIKEGWEEDDKKLMWLYGVNLDQPEIGLPKFGSGYRMEELRDAHVEAYRSAMGATGLAVLSKLGKKIRESSGLPTLLNLAWYFRCFDGAGMELLQLVAPQLPGPTADITRLLLQKSEDTFFHARVEPLRNFLEWKYDIYFYCLPFAVYETQLMGGKGWRPDGPLVLSILPKFPEVALSRGEQESKLIPFAGLVLWLVRSKLCVNSKTQEKMQDLRKVIGAWKPYMSTYHLIDELGKIEKNNPFLITEQVKHELLPPGALEMLRLPAQHEEQQDG